ncbi:hypothetical protein ACA29_05740 [Lederbergia galactosidilytica]|uniref:Uncharacterized protein n=1 Tax=Lederbergia galactosidilytica TaxID=217031 RepID=A0A0Q9Y0V1_9BACI|nr:hypothetical protein ACA29_05740 [Lederbergia galactosidilytica]
MIIYYRRQDFDITSRPYFDITSRPWYGAALEKDDVYFTEPYMDEVFGKVILSIMKPIKVNDEPAGFVAIDLFLDKLPDIMESYTLGARQRWLFLFTF